MSKLFFATGNTEKFRIAEAACKALGFGLDQAVLEVDEIQGEDSEVIALDKANRAFQALRAPVVINDDSWAIPGLNGFPGPYMKSVAHWLSAQDFLNLTRSLSDRRTILSQIIVYQDAHGTHTIKNEFTNTLLTEARGNYGTSWQKIVTVPSDNGLSVAEAYDKGASLRGREVTAGWDQFAKWYSETHL
jgi:non-canonical purine NTP pyrophosphatase (RdgB/HAM1 family)